MRVMTTEEAKAFESNEQIKYVTAKFQTAMSKFEAFESKVSILLSGFDAFSVKLGILESDYAKIIVILNNMNILINENASFSTNNERNALKTTGSILAQIESVKENLPELKSKLEQFQTKLTSVSNDVANSASAGHVSTLKHDLKNVVDEVRSKHQDHAEKIIQLDAKNNKMGVYAEQLNQQIASLSESFKKFEPSMKNMSADIGLGKQYTESLVSNIYNKLLNHIEDSISAIPKPVIPSLDDAKKAVEEKFAPVYLDAKNANLRSSNNEQKITILEKKVEQLQLLLNKLQLQG